MGGGDGVGHVVVTLVMTMALYSLTVTRGPAVARSGGGSSSSAVIARCASVISDDIISASCRDDDFSFNGRFPFGVSGKTVGKNVLAKLMIVVLVFKFPFFVMFVTFCFQCGGQGTGCELVRRTLTAKRPLPRNVFGSALPRSCHAGNVGGVYAKVKLFVFL